MSRFDPYREWLGIESNDKPTYYQLIGITPSEDDTNVIRQNALQRLKKLAGIDDPAREQLRIKLVQRVKRAAKCLLNDETRIAYDRRLLSSSERTAAHQLAAENMLDTEHPEFSAPKKAASVSETPAIDAAPKSKHSVSKRYRAKQRKTQALLLYGFFMFLSLGGIGFLVATQTEVGKSFWKTAEPTNPKASTVSSFDDGVEPLPMDEVLEPVTEQSHAQRSQPVDESTTAPPVNVITSGTSTIEPTAGEIHQLSDALVAAREALENRDPKRADELLRSVSDLNKRSRDEAKYRRLVALTYLVSEYWRAFEDALEALEAGTEISVGEQRMIVVELNSRELVLRYNGLNRTLSLDNLPTSLQVALADRWFDRKAASSKIFRGAMMAVSDEYSADQVRQTWRQARADGAKIDDDLELVLVDDYDLEN